jgi:3-hydroxybutyryl-CoA dehydrogenase
MGADRMPEKTIGIVGCGIMGSGIVQICAQAGFTTWVRELSDELLASGKQRVAKSLDSQVQKGQLSEKSRDAILSRTNWTTRLTDLKNCDFVIEAVIENIEIKKKLFEELGDMLDAAKVLASNTSSYSITELASAARYPERVVGFHFFYPVAMMMLVEVVKSEIASGTAIKRAMELAVKLGKDPIEVPDKPGFVVNRLLVPYFLDSIRALEEGLAGAGDIDKAMTEGAGFVIGPFRLLDHIGLDTIYSIANSFYDEFKEKRFAPPPLLKRMVMAGNLGRKTGRGFYTYKQSGES